MVKVPTAHDANRRLESRFSKPMSIAGVMAFL